MPRATSIAACARTRPGPRSSLRNALRPAIRLVTFSSDQVFDGSASDPTSKATPVAPLNVYGRSKAEAERDVLAHHPQALVVRTSAFFGPWDQHNFVVQALSRLGTRRAPSPHRTMSAISPTYVPDLVDVCLDLLIDGEAGIWHLANVGDVTWAELAERAAALAGVATTTLRRTTGAGRGEVAARPNYSVLSSERALLMPTLDDALIRFASEQQHIDLSRQRRLAG